MTTSRRKDLSKKDHLPKQSLCYWVFRLKNGKIVKYYGNNERTDGDSYEIWNDRAPIGAVRKDDVVETWQQNEEFSDRE